MHTREARDAMSQRRKTGAAAAAPGRGRGARAVVSRGGLQRWKSPNRAPDPPRLSPPASPSALAGEGGGEAAGWGVFSTVRRPTGPKRRHCPSTLHPTVLRTATFSREGRGKANAQDRLPFLAKGSQPFISRRDDRRSGQATQGRRSAPPRRGWPQASP